MRPSGRMFCFTAPPRAPAGACSAPPPARPGAPGEQRSESFPPTQRPSGTLPARAKCGTLSSQRPRTPPAPGQILREHPTCVPRPSPVRNTSPTYPSGNARQAALRDVEPGSLAPPRGCPPSPCTPASPSRSRHAAPDLPRPSHAVTGLYKLHTGHTGRADRARHCAMPRAPQRACTGARHAKAPSCRRAGRGVKRAKRAPRQGSAVDSLKRLSP